MRQSRQRFSFEYHAIFRWRVGQEAWANPVCKTNASFNLQFKNWGIDYALLTYRRHIFSWKKLCNRNISHSHTVGELFLTWEPSSVVCLYRSMASSFPMISAMVAFKIKYHKSVTKLRNRTTKVTESLHHSELLHKISLRTQSTFDFAKSHGWEDNRRSLLQYILTCEQSARTSAYKGATGNCSQSIYERTVPAEIPYWWRVTTQT